MSKYNVLLIFLHLLSIGYSTEVKRPRGVSLTNKIFYDSSLDFTCLDGSKTISFSFVNDDYCDCADGSDEPGTSACSNGNFFCLNSGFKPKTILSSRVNDGICDCCDGSDEWKNPSLCLNTCADLYKVDQKEREASVRLLNQGKALREQFSKAGEATKKSREKQLQEAEEKLITILEKEVETQREKETIETKEQELKSKHEKAELEFKETLEKENDNKASVEAFENIDVDRNGFVTLQELASSNNNFEPDSITEQFHDNSVDKIKFQEIVWPLIKEKYSSENKLQLPPQPPKETDKDETNDEYEEENEDTEFPEEEEEDDEDGNVKEKSETNKENNIDYDLETLETIKEADTKRNAHEQVLKEKQKISSEIKNLKTKLSFDFGPDNCFQVLEGNCYELKTNEYKYQLCPFDKTTQSQLHGGSTTSLGKWGSWQGKNHSEMKYEKGLGCWNGPARSTKVILECGSEHKLVLVDEPSRCSYLFKFTTPCACHNNNHDEL